MSHFLWESIRSDARNMQTEKQGKVVNKGMKYCHWKIHFFVTESGGDDKTNLVAIVSSYKREFLIPTSRLFIKILCGRSGIGLVLVMNEKNGG